MSAALAATSWLLRCASTLSVSPQQVEATAGLLREEATPPFIVRYRADATGGLDEQQVLAVRKALQEQDALEVRRQAVLKALQSKDNVGGALLAAVRAVSDLHELEDLYAPYKTKASTLADAARTKGLGPLADRVWSDPNVPNDVMRKAEADAGVMHLLAERISQSVEARGALREHFWRQASLVLSEPKAGGGSGSGSGKEGGGSGRDKGSGGTAASGKGGGGGKVGGGKGGSKETSADVTHLIGSSCRVCQLVPHRTLAINRAEARKALRVAVTLPEKKQALTVLCGLALPRPRGGRRGELLQAAAADAFSRLLQPAMGRDVRRRLMEEAEAAAARVFSQNLRSLLMQRPVRAMGTLLGVDPGFTSGCKLAVISERGDVLASGTIHPHPPRAERDRARRTLRDLAEQHGVGVVAIGDGTGARLDRLIEDSRCAATRPNMRPNERPNERPR